MTQTRLSHLHRGGLAVRERAAIATDHQAPTLVWIHGLGESGLGFEGAMAARNLDGFAHLAPDLLGYGRSPWPEEPMALGDHAEHLRSWLERWTDGKILLAGHSMGGVVGTLLCERPGALEGRIVGFVNVEGNISPTDCTNSATAQGYSLQAFLDHGFARLADEIYDLGVADPANRGYYPSLRLADPRSFHLDSCELVEVSARREMARRLGALELPRVYIHGAPGGAQTPTLELLDAAGIERLAIEPAGHWPFIDQPEAFAAALGEWLGRALPR